MTDEDGNSTTPPIVKKSTSLPISARSTKRTSAMARFQFMLAPLLVSVGLLSYGAYQDTLDVETVVGVVVFLIIAVPISLFGYRLTLKQRERVRAGQSSDQPRSS